MLALASRTIGTACIVPDRLVELTERWSNPLQWQAILRDFAELTHRRETIRETWALARHMGNEFADRAAYIVKEEAGLADDCESRCLALRAELSR